MELNNRNCDHEGTAGGGDELKIKYKLASVCLIVSKLFLQIMKFSTVFSAVAIALGIASAAPLEERAPTVKGFDISNWQPNVDWTCAKNNGAHFVIIKVINCSSPYLLPLLPLFHG
jgi:GH25 family lysozyme M1 (1,4-beta-N-acetylmuramidase)